jgi:hypothetical protein
MPADTHTLDLFFGLKSGDGKAPQELTAAVRAAVAKEIREAAKTVAAARLFTGKAPETQLDLAATEVIGFLRRAIADVSIPQVLAGCWSKYAALRKYSNALDYPADKTYVEPFFTQTLTSAHHPFIELKLGGVPTGKVEFEVEVQVTFEEVSLSIRAGRIVAARPGKTSASGTIKCEGTPVVTRTLGELELPGEMHFHSGIAIGAERSGLESFGARPQNR